LLQFGKLMHYMDHVIKAANNTLDELCVLTLQRNFFHALLLTYLFQQRYTAGLQFIYARFSQYLVRLHALCCVPFNW